MMTKLVYDGTFDGFLSCVYYLYEHKLSKVSIVQEQFAAQNFFDSFQSVPTELEKSRRVWRGIGTCCSQQGKSKMYKAFLSELPDIEEALLYYIRKSFYKPFSIDSNYADPHILRIAKVAKMVGREKHRMDAFVRFRLTKDSIYLATIEPDFNVLPLNAKHFLERYADQKWLIYDLRRKYGLYYDLNSLETVTLELSDAINSDANASVWFSSEEIQFQELWKNYFQSTNIPSRKNMKLHLKHVPKRYWQYLSEKSPLK